MRNENNKNMLKYEWFVEVMENIFLWFRAREYRTYRVVTTSRFKTPRRLVVQNVHKIQ